MSNKLNNEIEDVSNSQSGWFGSEWLRWNKFSPVMLRTAEKKILSYLKTPFKAWYVNIGSVVGSSDKIWTISVNTESKNTPLVMLHGLGAGVALWCLNLDDLAQKRPVYAIDLLGFGRSSRPDFSKDSLEAEKQMVQAIEAWRREVNLDKFILLGHSMGGFLAASYALKYPEKVKHLILADPWGFQEKPPDSQRKPIPLWVKAIVYTLQPFNPLTAVRVAGPWGQWLINKTRPDINKKFSDFIKEDGLIPQYLYQCNAQNPTGESAFHSMMLGFGWAKHPMIRRIYNLDPTVPITLIYGSRSWIDNSAGISIRENRTESYVSVKVLAGAGHHVFADKPVTFNKYVIEACETVDTDKSQKKVHVPLVNNRDDRHHKNENRRGSECKKTISVENEDASPVDNPKSTENILPRTPLPNDP